MIPGMLELAKEMLQGNVRTAIPDYIGVREPQYTNGVGLIQFAYKNVKVQGKEVAASVTGIGVQPEREAKKQDKASKPKGEKPKAKMSKFFLKYFF